MKKLIIGFCFFVCAIATSQTQEIDPVILDNLGRSIDSALYAGNGAYLNDLFEKSYMINQVITKSDDSYIKEFNKGFEESLSTSFDLGGRIIREVGNSGSYDFVKSRANSKGEYHLLFRLYGEQEGLNYHDFKIQRVDGSYVILDVYVYTVGEYLSETMKSLYTIALSDRPGILDKLLKRSIQDDFLKIKEIKLLVMSGDYEKANNTYKKLSSEILKQKSIQLTGIQIASNIDEKTWGEHIKRYKASFPNDPSLYLVSIDGYILSQEYEKALSTVDKLDSALEGDSFLNMLRANIHYMLKDLDKAIELIEVMMDDYPYSIDAFDTALTLYVEHGKYDKAIEVLNIMNETFELDMDVLKQVVTNGFPEFSKSPQYIKWSK